MASRGGPELAMTNGSLLSRVHTTLDCLNVRAGTDSSRIDTARLRRARRACATASSNTAGHARWSDGQRSDLLLLLAMLQPLGRTPLDAAVPASCLVGSS